jgi:hypothetical protein
LEKRGKGRFYGDIFIQKIPLNPPLPKGEDTRKDSRQIQLETIFLTGHARMTTGLE